MHSQENADVLEDRHFLLLKPWESHIDKHGLWGALAEDDLLSSRITSRHLHFGSITDIVSCVCHKEFEVEATEGVKEIEAGAVEGAVALQLKLESDILSTW